MVGNLKAGSKAPDLDELRRAIRQRPGRAVEAEAPRAAVASIFRPGDAGTEVLLIERTRRAGDPWSGHMAFPGGRAEEHDADSQATAERETREEIGLDLGSAERLGRLDDLDGRRATGRRMIVSAHVYSLPNGGAQLTPNHEVAAALWVPLAELLSPERYVDYRASTLPWTTFPGIRIGDGRRVVWGLTFRFFEDLFGRLGTAFPVKPG